MLLLPISALLVTMPDTEEHNEKITVDYLYFQNFIAKPPVLVMQSCHFYLQETKVVSYNINQLLKNRNTK